MSTLAALTVRSWCIRVTHRGRWLRTAGALWLPAGRRGPWEYLKLAGGRGKLWTMYANPDQCHPTHIVNRSNGRSASTTSSLRSGTLREPPPGQRTQPSEASYRKLLAARDIRKPLTISVRFVGNGDCEWVIEARGKRYKAAGCENVHEVLARLSRATY